MPEVAPFRGIRYSSKADLASVTSPPYDVISPSERLQLEDASPYNVVRLDLGPSSAGADKYEQSAALLSSWLTSGILVEDPVPTLTLYEEVAGGRRSFGILASVEISDEILPHERTMAPVVSDRLEVIRATRANISPVMCLYWSDEEALARPSTPPDVSFDAGDVSHAAWTITDVAAIERAQKVLSSARVVIADGHHRFRTAEAYRDEMRASSGAGPWDRTLLYLVDASRDAPALLPIHRLVFGLLLPAALDRMRPAFSIEPSTAPDLASAVAAAPGRSYGLFDRSGAWLATLRDEDAARAATEGEHCEAWRNLDVAVLHELVFKRLLGDPEVTFVHSASEASDAVTSGAASFAVLLGPTPVDAVREIAEAHDSMPPKSTFFTPKPRTGIVIRSVR